MLTLVKELLQQDIVVFFIFHDESTATNVTHYSPKILAIGATFELVTAAMLSSL